MKDLMEILGTGVLLFVIGGMAYGILMLIFNGVLSSLNVRFKLPVQKRFVGKMTPIYGLSAYHDDTKGLYYYYVSKWELEYVDIEMGCWQTVFIPFSPLFKRLQYVKKQNFNLGQLEDKYVQNLNLEEVWNVEYNKWDEERKKEQSEKDKFKNMMNNLNKEFNENYTE